MSELGNSQIRQRVQLLVDGYIAARPTGVPPPIPAEQELIRAGVDLVVNVLQNLNDIAYTLEEHRQWAENQRGR